MVENNGAFGTNHRVAKLVSTTQLKRAGITGLSGKSVRTNLIPWLIGAGVNLQIHSFAGVQSDTGAPNGPGNRLLYHRYGHKYEFYIERVEFTNIHEFELYSRVNRAIVLVLKIRIVI